MEGVIFTPTVSRTTEFILGSDFPALAIGAWEGGVRGAICKTTPSTPAILVFPHFFPSLFLNVLVIHHLAPTHAYSCIY